MTTEIRKSKDNENNKFADKLKSSILGPKDWWKTLKHFIKPTSTSFVPPLCKQGVIYSDDMEKAEILIEHFHAQNTWDERNASLPSANFDHDNTLHIIQFIPSQVENVENVENVLNSLNTRKAAFLDCINRRILKELSRPLISYLCDLFNFSMACGKMPDIRNKLISLLLKNNPSDPAKYRSILISIRKALENK